MADDYLACISRLLDSIETYCFERRRRRRAMVVAHGHREVVFPTSASDSRYAPRGCEADLRRT